MDCGLRCCGLLFPRLTGRAHFTYNKNSEYEGGALFGARYEEPSKATFVAPTMAELERQLFADEAQA